MVSHYEFNSYIDSFDRQVELDLRFDIAPQSQLRPRATSRGGFVRVYDPKQTAEYKAKIKASAKELLENADLKKSVELMDGLPLQVVINTYQAMPESWSMKKKLENRGSFKVSKPDSDNLAKPILDALNGVIWKDDSLIVDLHIIKQYVDATSIYADGKSRPYIVAQETEHFTLNVRTM